MTGNIAKSKSFRAIPHTAFKRGKDTMRRNRLVLTKALIVIVLAAMTTAAQDYQIRTRVDLVVVPVTVKGSGDQLVSGLTKTDFRIYENGKEQKITNFTID